MLAAAAVTLAVSVAYTIFLNPEIRLYRHAANVKERWMKRLDEHSGNKYIIFGGSSCATSVMGQRLLDQHGLLVANLGFNAGMGATLLTRYALKHAHTGDTLIMAIEPALLNGSSSIPSLGKQFALATGNSDLLECSTLDEHLSALWALRPGGYHFFTLLGKVFTRQPLYRYGPGDFDVSGYQQVRIRRDFEGLPGAGPQLSSSARDLLSPLRSTCQNRGIRLVYALPWFYAPAEALEKFQSGNVDFLLQIAEFMPVLADEKFGVHSIREDFADTPLHLTPEGAALRTDALARQLKEGKTWSVADLRRLRDSFPRGD